MFVVGGGRAETSGTVDLAERVHGAGNAVLLQGIVQGDAQRVPHADKRPSRVYSQENIVYEDHRLEEWCLAERPWLQFPLLVQSVHGGHDNGVDESDGDWNLPLQRVVVEPCWYLKGNSQRQVV